MADLAKKISTLVGLIVLVFSGFFFLEARHAPMKAHAALEKRVTLQELQRQLRQAEDDAAYYRQQLRKYPADNRIRDRLTKAENRVQQLETAIRKKAEEL